MDRLMAPLLAAKSRRRRDLAALPIEEKLGIVLELQRNVAEIRKSAGRPGPEPWDPSCLRWRGVRPQSVQSVEPGQGPLLIEDVDHRIREIVGRIVAEFSPSKVLLFGSRARGDARPDSDVDLIVVWKDESPPAKRSAAVRLALGRIGFPMDLAVVTPSEFARLKEWRGHVFHSADREGVVLHAS